MSKLLVHRRDPHSGDELIPIRVQARDIRVTDIVTKIGEGRHPDLFGARVVGYDYSDLGYTHLVALKLDRSRGVLLPSDMKVTLLRWVTPTIG